MGNIRSKNTLLGILKKWEESSPYGNEYQSYSCKINDVSIHRLNGEYYVESPFATIGPMNKEQLIMISKKSSNFQLRTAYTQLTSNGDTTEPELLNKKLLVSMKNCSRKFMKPEDILTFNETDLFIPKDKNSKIKNNLAIEKDGENFSKFRNDMSKDMVSICSPDDKSSITNISTNIELCSECQKSPRRNSIKIKLQKTSKSSIDVSKCLKTTSNSDIQQSKSIKFMTKNFEIPPDIQNPIRSTNFDRKACLKYGRVKNKKPNVTAVKPLNLSSTKKLLKRQFNRKIIEEYKEIQMLNHIKKQVELKSAGDTCLQNSDSVEYRPTVQTLGFSEPINNEKFRYTAYVKADNINWCKQKSLLRRLKIGFEEKFGCSVNLGDEVIEFRGNVIYTVNIEGKDKVSVIKCRNSLPFELRAHLILSKNVSEESSGVISEKWKTLTPYNPKPIQKFGSKAIKLSY